MNQGQDDKYGQFGQYRPGSENMNENYSYERYDYQPSRRRGGIVGGFVNRLRNPLFATALVLIGGAAVASIFILSGAGGESEKDIPIVQADSRPYREAPEDRGGMRVANQDSTIYNTMRSRELAERPPVENLLEEDPAFTAADEGESLSSFAWEAESMIEKPEPAMSSDSTAAAGDAAEAGAGSTSAPTKVQSLLDPPASTAETSTADATSVEPASGDQTATGSEQTASAQGMEAPDAPQQKPSRIHAPASSPETLAFVRSVLDKKDGVSATESRQSASTVRAEETVAAIEPAAGAATGAARALEPGRYYVQLASVSSETGAHNEWKKIKGEFSYDLQNAGYRIEKADLGERGVYFRIQAGPMSESSARSLCADLKSRKPGGCLVVQ